MKPYEEIDFPNGFLRWIREDGMYVCSLTEEQMIKIKALHEAPRIWVGLTDEDIGMCLDAGDGSMSKIISFIEAKLEEKNT